MGSFAAAVLVSVAVDQIAKGAASRRSYNTRPGLALASRFIGGLGLVLAAGFAAGVILLSDENDIVLSVGLGCAVGGALSNYLDLLLRGAVVDHLRMAGVSRRFNFADAFIAMGSVAAIVGYVGSI